MQQVKYFALWCAIVMITLMLHGQWRRFGVLLLLFDAVLRRINI